MMMQQLIAVEKNINRDRYNFVFIMLVVLMVGLGLATLYSGSLHYAERFFGNPFYFVLRQFRNLLAGVFGLIFFAFFGIERLRKLLPYLLILGFILAVLPFVPGIASPRNGANRWIAIGGVSLQPSEFIKLILIIFLANFFDKKAEHLDAPFISVLPPFFIASLFVLLVYLENDFSTSVFLMLIFMMMFFAAGGPILWFIKGLVVMVPCAVLMVVTSTYRMKRVLSFLSPEHDPLGAGYQINAALEALASSGLWGAGLGNGVHKISSVPEIYSDFIFVVWAEEMGFAGVCLYIFLLFLFAITAYLIAFSCGNRFGAYLAFGSVSAITVQSFLNLGVVVRLVPATGIPLPFFSFGGSSLITTLCLCGLIINVSGCTKRSINDV
ncbi:MAG: putative lipid II flippase FtsW [Treponema sp.]